MKVLKLNRISKVILISFTGLVLLFFLVGIVLNPFWDYSVNNSFSKRRVYTFNTNQYIEKRIIADEVHNYFYIEKGKETLIFKFSEFRTDTSMLLNVESNVVQFFHWNNNIDFDLVNSEIGRFAFEIRIVDPDEFLKLPYKKEEYLIR